MTSLADPAAQRRWDAYFSEVDRLLRRTGGDTTGLRAELETHVADSLAAAPVGTELERLEAALSRLGRPSEYICPPSTIGGAGWNGSATVRRLFRGACAAVYRLAIAVGLGAGWLSFAVLAAMVVLKPFQPGHVGLFRGADGTVSAGIVAQPGGARELLGWLSLPVALLLAVLLYRVLAVAMRDARKHRPTRPGRAVS